MASRANRAIVLVAVAVTLASAVALGRAWFVGTTATASGPEATMDGITVEVQTSEWAPMDPMDDSAGFAMPGQMMPGAPTGEQVRLGVRVTLHNTLSDGREFSLPEEFTLEDGVHPEPLRLTADTVGPLRQLAAGSSLHTVLYFDLKASEGEDLPSLYLNWTRERDTIAIPVPRPGEAPPAHEH